MSAMYTKSLVGLVECYTLAIPFLGGTSLRRLSLFNNLYFTAYSLAFSKGRYYWIKRTILAKSQTILNFLNLIGFPQITLYISSIDNT